MRNAPDPGEGRGALVGEHQSQNADGVSQSSNAAQALPIIIARFWKNWLRNEIIRVELTEYEQHKLINVRIWTTGDDGIDRPSPKGVAMGISKLPELAAALNKAEARARELGLIGSSS